ncbi:hypothetical protein AURDEDRAFT_175199 [Auricularia subglabra TFB-10046 SS5]|nr:hypothetical protein AURDEDRAFT_175199 [Auricularia subglabra TFB-10046 SS5]
MSLSSTMLPSSCTSTAPRRQSLVVGHRAFANVTNHHPSPCDLKLRAPAVAKPSRPATPSAGLNICQEVKLSKEQQEAVALVMAGHNVALVMAGHNVFLTGSAGDFGMIEASLFDKVILVAGALNSKNQNRPISSGGIQIIVAGDFFQLPPVCKTQGASPVFMFNAKTWSEVIVRGVTLKHIFRQHNTAFASFLDQVRGRSMSDECIAFFKSLSRELDKTDGIAPAQL